MTMFMEISGNGGGKLIRGISLIRRKYFLEIIIEIGTFVEI